MKSIMQTVVILFASAVLFTSCAHKWGHSQCSACKGSHHGTEHKCAHKGEHQCDHKSDADKTGKKEECEQCKKGS